MTRRRFEPHCVTAPLMRITAALLLTLAPCLTALAAETVAVSPADITNVKSLEEVTVTGSLNSLSKVRAAITAAEDRFYARYNELNQNHAYDILCKWEAPTGSGVNRRVCQARYVDEETRSEAAKLSLSVSEGIATLQSPDAIRLAGIAELRKRSLEMVRKDPELLRSLLERARLEKHYEDLRKEKFKDGWMVSD